MKKKIDIEALLKWTYCEELPKLAKGWERAPVGQSNFHMIIDLAVLGTRVDTFGRTPGAQIAALHDEPHPDALVVHEAVCGLNALQADLPEDWSPMPELARFGVHGQMALKAAIGRLTVCDAAGNRHLRGPLANLVRRHAILGNTPLGSGTDGADEVPVLKPVRGPDGGPIWYLVKTTNWADPFGNARQSEYETDDGWNRNRKAPKRGAYQKYFLDPDPVSVLVERGEYELWLAALMCLSESLEGTLCSHEVSGPIRPVAPWQPSEWRDMARQSVVLHDMVERA